MKIFYLSNACFSDCEINILNQLSVDNEITYGVVFQKKNSNYTIDELNSAFKNSNVILYPIHLKFRLRNPILLLTYLKLVRKISINKPDAIYINNYGDLYLNSILTLFLNSKNTIIGIHDVLQHSGNKFTAILDFFNELFYKKFKFFLTFSKSQADIFEENFPNKKVSIIPLALKDFGLKHQKVKHDGITRFLFFGNIKPYKGLDILIEACDGLSKTYNNFELIIAGRCEEWEETYVSLIKGKSYIQADIRFIKNDEIPQFFSSAHYLILPYKDVTQSGPLMIAYNYDLPVIASDVEGFKEFIENSVTGYLFDRNNVLALQNLLKEAILRNEDEYHNLIDQLVKYKKENFSENVILMKYKRMFNDILNEKSKI